MKDENDNKTIDYIKNDIAKCNSCNRDITEYTGFVNGVCNICDDAMSQESSHLSLTINMALAVAFSDIGKADLKLFIKIVIDIAKQDPRAIFELNQSHMAEKYPFKQSNISRSLKKLIENKLIIKLEDNKYKLGISK